jgi:ATP-dependent DNA helicase RecG
VLSRLAQDSLALLEPTRKTRHYVRPEYRLRASALQALGSAVRYRRRTVDEIDRKVIAHVQEYGRITNRTLQNLLEVDVYRASDILRDLSERGLIVRTSRQTRGPAVEYGPGTSFPRRRRAARVPGEETTQLALDDDSG